MPASAVTVWLRLGVTAGRFGRPPATMLPAGVDADDAPSDRPGAVETESLAVDGESLALSDSDVEAAEDVAASPADERCADDPSATVLGATSADELTAPDDALEAASGTWPATPVAVDVPVTDVVVEPVE